MRWRAPFGTQAAKASTTMPPSDGPTTAWSCSMPSVRAASKPARARSSTEISGKSICHARPVAGLIDDGPVEPKQLPSEFTHMTKKRSVSSVRPGPIIRSHQPSSRLRGVEAACELGERPVNSRIALLREAFRRPQLSYAMTPEGSSPPRHSLKGRGSSAYETVSPKAASSCTAAFKVPDPRRRRCLRTAPSTDSVRRCPAPSRG